eukprot:2751681-Prorocentrum_lima.AAC.1
MTSSLVGSEMCIRDRQKRKDTKDASQRNLRESSRILRLKELMENMCGLGGGMNRTPGQSRILQ